MKKHLNVIKFIISSKQMEKSYEKLQLKNIYIHNRYK